VDVGERGIGSVAPLGGPQARPQRLREREQLGAVDRGLAALLAARVLLLDGAAHRRDVAGEHLFGDRAMLGRQLLEHRGAVPARGTQPFRLRLRWLLRAGTRWAPARAACLVVAERLAGPLPASVTPPTAFGSFGVLGHLRPVAVAPAVAFARTPVAGPAIARRTLAALAATTAHERRGDEILVAPWLAQQLDPFRFVALLLLNGGEPDDGDPVEIEVGLCPQHVARLGAGRHEVG